MKLNDKGAVAVDEYSRTNVEHIWAMGDVTDRMQPDPGRHPRGPGLRRDRVHDRPTAFDHDDVPPRCSRQPPVGVVGLTEAEARHVHGEVDIYLTRFRPMRTGFVGGDERMMMKLVVDPGAAGSSAATSSAPMRRR